MITCIQVLADIGGIPSEEWAMAGLVFGPVVAVAVGVHAFCQRRQFAGRWGLMARIAPWLIVLIAGSWTLAGLALLGPAGNRSFVAIGLLLAGLTTLVVCMLTMLLHPNGEPGRLEQQRLAAEEFRRGC